MTRMTNKRPSSRCGQFAFLTIASLFCLSIISTPAAAEAISVTSFGNPIWEPVDFHLFTAPLGDGVGDPAFEEFRTTATTILPSPNHEFNPQLFVGPGAAHSGFETEIGDGVANAGYPEKVIFNAEDFTPLAGVILSWMNVAGPNAPDGTNPEVPDTPDYDTGPTISNDLFPISGLFTVRRNGELYEPVSDMNPPLPPLDDSLSPPFNVEGYSHFPIFFGESTLFADPPVPTAGEYSYNIKLEDQAGNGYVVTAEFAVVPEPTSFALASFAILGLMMTRRRRS